MEEAVLGRERIAEIEDQAEATLATAFGSFEAVKLPVDVNVVTGALGLELLQGDFENASVAGLFDRPSRTIYVDRRDQYERQAFSVAHEIGHFLRHADKADDVFYRREEVGEADQLMEQEANWFAAALLMPDAMVRSYYDLLPDVDSMAGLFRVSPLAMRYRLRNLGLIGPDR